MARVWDPGSVLSGRWSWVPPFLLPPLFGEPYVAAYKVCG